MVFRGTWRREVTFGRGARPTKVAAKRSIMGSMGAQLQADMIKEVTVMVEWPHQNVLIVYGVCELPGLGLHVVCELMAGDLDEMIHSGAPLSRADAIRVSRDVAAGLAHLHAQNVMHCDLKPANVLLAIGATVHAKVADFGISRELAATLTKMTTVQGTVAYSAPEVLAEEQVSL